MIVIEIQNGDEKYQHVFEITENNENGEVEIGRSIGISIADEEFDNIWDTNNTKIRIQLENEGDEDE